MLQETHCLEKDETLWISKWGNDIIFSHGTSHSCGVAVLLDSRFEYVIDDTDRDSKGRYILVRFKIQNETLVIVNVYAPTKDDNKSQKLYFQQLSKKLDFHIGCNIIVGGDFNVCLNPDMDKRGGTKLKQSLCAKFIETMSEDLDLIDIWRVLNEDTKRFT